MEGSSYLRSADKLFSKAFFLSDFHNILQLTIRIFFYLQEPQVVLDSRGTNRWKFCSCETRANFCVQSNVLPDDKLGFINYCHKQDLTGFSSFYWQIFHECRKCWRGEQLFSLWFSRLYFLSVLTRVVIALISTCLFQSWILLFFLPCVSFLLVPRDFFPLLLWFSLCNLCDLLHELFITPKCATSVP